MNDDFAMTAGWGHYGAGDAVMPGGGRAGERAYSDYERDALGDALPALGETAFDVYLNERAFWRCVPAKAWNYKLGRLPSPEEMALLPRKRRSQTLPQT